MSTRVLLNPTAPGPVVRPSGDPLAFHRRLPGYAPTPLVDAPGIAADLGVGAVWVKDESARLGLPSYKILQDPRRLVGGVPRGTPTCPAG